MCAPPCTSRGDARARDGKDGHEMSRLNCLPACDVAEKIASVIGGEGGSAKVPRPYGDIIVICGHNGGVLLLLSIHGPDAEAIFHRESQQTDKLP